MKRVALRRSLPACLLLAILQHCHAYPEGICTEEKFDPDVYKYFFGSRPTSRAAVNVGFGYRIWNLEVRNGKYIIPYVYNQSIPVNNSMIPIIESAFADFNRTGLCFQFEPRSNQDYYISFQDDPSEPGCWAYVSRRLLKNQPNQINLLYPGCHPAGTVVHEILHTLGFYHEHQRPDRDNYVLIHESNIKSDYQSAFRKLSDVVINSLNVTYDFRSVMHYPYWAFANKKSLPTITFLNGSNVPNQRDGMTDLDALQLSLLYDCAAINPTTEAPKTSVKESTATTTTATETSTAKTIATTTTTTETSVTESTVATTTAIETSTAKSTATTATATKTATAESTTFTSSPTTQAPETSVTESTATTATITETSTTKSTATTTIAREALTSDFTAAIAASIKIPTTKPIAPTATVPETSTAESTAMTSSAPEISAPESDATTATATETSSAESTATTSNRGCMLHGANIYVVIISAWKILGDCD